MSIFEMMLAAGLVLLVVLFYKGNGKGKQNKKMTCDGCPHYSSCRAHIGCHNNPKNR